MSDDLELNQLVVRCLEALEESGPAALELLYAQHPAESGRLRARISMLRAAGLLGSEAQLEEFPERLGEFRLLSRLGSGGMGVVFLAEQESLGRRVALKLIRPDQLYFQGARERFQREVEAVARLSHPGIVSVHVVGEERGIPYFAMEHVAGISLGAALEALRGRAPDGLMGRDLYEVVERLARTAEPGRPDDPIFAGDWTRACLWIAREVAQALEHAHQRGVLHRDVKPTNVMLTPGGRVLLLDFGLAASGKAGRMTRTGSQIGSLPYMAPEQMRGERTELDARTDVYGLAATLYELLSLRAAFRQTTALELQGAIVAGAAPRLRQLRPSLSRDVEAIVAVAMDPERDRRYASAADFALDITRVLEGRPVTARPAGMLVQIGRWSRRNPGSAAAVALAALIAVGGPSVFGVQQARAAKKQRELTAQVLDQRRIAETNLAQALRAVDEMLTRVGSERLAHVPQLEAVRLELLAAAQAFYAELARGTAEPEAILLERLKVGISLAELANSLDRSSETAEAVADAKQDLAALEKLRGQDETVARLGRKLESCQGNLALDLGRNEEARVIFERRVEFERSVSGGPDAAMLAGVLHNLGLALVRLGREEEASAAVIEAINVLRAADSAGDAGEDVTFKLLETLMHLGTLRERSGQFEPAINLLQEAAEIGERYHAANATDSGMRRQLVRVYANLVNPLRKAGRLAESLEAGEIGLRHGRVVTALFPEDFAALLALATLQLNHGLGLWNDKQLDQALESFDEALAGFDRMAEEEPTNAEGLRRVAFVLGNRGGLQRELGRLEEAARDLDRAVELHRQLGSGTSPDDQLALHYGVALANRALAAISTGDHERAMTDLRESLPLFRTQPFSWNQVGVHCMKGVKSALESPTMESNERARVVETYCEIAIEALREAVRAGVAEPAELHSHERWEPLRGRPEFEELLGG